MWTEIILKTIDSFKKEMNEMENKKKLFTNIDEKDAKYLVSHLNHP